MFGKHQAESPKDNGNHTSANITLLESSRRRQPLTNAEISAKQEWLEGFVSAWTVGRSI